MLQFRELPIFAQHVTITQNSELLFLMCRLKLKISPYIMIHISNLCLSSSDKMELGFHIEFFLILIAQYCNEIWFKSISSIWRKARDV